MMTVSQQKRLLTLLTRMLPQLQRAALESGMHLEWVNFLECMGLSPEDYPLTNMLTRRPLLIEDLALLLVMSLNRKPIIYTQADFKRAQRHQLIVQQNDERTKWRLLVVDRTP